MFEWRDHTAEIELHIEAPTPPDVFREAAAAFAELIDGDAAAEAEDVEHAISLSASDHASLLVQWLEELLYLADADRFVPLRVASLDLGETRLMARVEGARGSPRPLLKAVTYHGLEFGERDGAWHAKLVLDV